MRIVSLLVNIVLSIRLYIQSVLSEKLTTYLSRFSLLYETNDR